jgi:hypothetical protein
MNVEPCVQEDEGGGWYRCVPGVCEGVEFRGITSLLEMKSNCGHFSITVRHPAIFE